MTKVLYWNIENFGIKKIQNPYVNRVQLGSGKNQAAASADRSAYIINHIDDLDPDIFVVVEIETPYWGDAWRGSLCGGEGATGSLVLLNRMRLVNANWSLVPPLVTGNKEAVSVYYRSDRLLFTGPNWWQGGFGPVPAGAGAGGAATYAFPWNNCLPGGAGDTRAAKVQFVDTYDMLGGDVDFGPDTRHPYQTTFTELAGAGRTLNLYSVHAPANFVSATDFMDDLSKIDDFAAAPPANEVQLVLGDFNLSLLSGINNNYTQCYDPLTVLGSPFTIALCPAGLAPFPLDGYRGYFATHLTSRFSAACWSTNAETRYYPTYAYTGKPPNRAYESIDNFLYRALPGVIPGGLPHLTIINGLVGSPYGEVVPAPGGAPTGNEGFNRFVDWDWNGQNPQGDDAPHVAPLYTAWTGITRAFRSWNIFNMMRSTSDHLALCFEV